MKKQLLLLSLLIKTSLFASLLDINQFIEYSDYSDSSEKVVKQETKKNTDYKPHKLTQKKKAKYKPVQKKALVKQTLLSTMLALSVYEQKTESISYGKNRRYIPYKHVYKPQPTKDCNYRKKQTNNRIQQYRKN